jgi:leukotriene-A4 hydrolase
MEYDASLAIQAYDLAAKWDASRDTPISALPFNAKDLAQFDGNQKSEVQNHAFRLLF